MVDNSMAQRYCDAANDLTAKIINGFFCEGEDPYDIELAKKTYLDVLKHRNVATAVKMGLTKLSAAQTEFRPSIVRICAAMILSGFFECGTQLNQETCDDEASGKLRGRMPITPSDLKIVEYFGVAAKFIARPCARGGEDGFFTPSYVIGKANASILACGSA